MTLDERLEEIRTAPTLDAAAAVLAGVQDGVRDRSFSLADFETALAEYRSVWADEIRRRAAPEMHYSRGNWSGD